MLFKKLRKEENGFTGQDILIAVFMVTIFLSLLGGIFINLSKTSKEIRQIASITDSFTKIAEKVDSMTYDEVDAIDSEGGNISNLIDMEGIVLNPGVDFEFRKSESNDEERTTQIIEIIGKYTIANKENTMQITLKKVAYTGGEGTGEPGDEPGNGGEILPTGASYCELTYPFNEPEEITNYRPVKRIWDLTNNSATSYWVQCSIDDPEWYSVEEGNFPMYVKKSAKTSKARINGVNNTKYYPTSSTTFYVWIPRISGNTENYSFAYETSNSAIEALAPGGYKIGEDLGQYTRFNNQAVFGLGDRGFLQGFKLNTKTFVENNLGGRQRVEHLPTDLFNLIKSVK